MTRNRNFILRIFLTAIVFAATISLLASHSNAADQLSPGEETYEDGCVWSSCEGLIDGLESSTCGICPSELSTWDSPKLRLEFKSWDRAFTGDVTRHIPVNECTWIGLFRACARRTSSGCITNDDGDKICDKEFDGRKYNYGNLTGNDIETERIQLCAFEDSMDAMDSDGGFSPFHEGTPNDEALDLLGSIQAGAAIAGVAYIVGPTIIFGPGGIIGGTITAGIGAIGGAIASAISQTWNHVVIRDLGCVDLPMAKGPPVWKNSAWSESFTPKPEMTLGTPSTFDAPSVNLSICKKDGKISSCTRNAEGQLKTGINITQSITLTPTANNNFKNRTTTQDGRIFEARISTIQPNKVCVYRINGAGDDLGTLQGCLPRPGYMPKPEVTTSSSSTAEIPKINVALGADNVDLWENPQVYDPSAISVPANQCGTVNQVEFCARRTCLDAEPLSPSNPTCDNWDERVCATGYDKAPLVVVDNKTYKTISKTQIPPGNETLPSSYSYLNPQINPEIKADGSLDYEATKVSFNKDVLFYNPPKCYQYDKTGACLNYDTMPNAGVCCSENPSLCSGIAEPYTNDAGQCTQYVRNTTSGDPYFIDPDKYTLRPLSSEEMGFCLLKPASKLPWVASKPGTYEYTPPSNCAAVSVELWGAGGAGHNGPIDNSDWSGGSGGYIKAIVPISDSKEYRVTVGKGGNFSIIASIGRSGANGGNSSFMTLQSSPILTATGGSGGAYTSITTPLGGTSTYSSSYRENNQSIADIIQKNGQPGANANCNLKNGGGSWSPETSSYVLSDKRTRQCDGIAYYESDLHINTSLPSSSINNESNLSYPSTPAVGGCTSGNCSSNGYYGHVGIGGHGKARIICVEDVEDANQL